MPFERRKPSLSAALERAHRERVLTRIDLGALSLAEARAFLGESLDATETAALYEESAGNPFYLQELARTLELAPGAASAATELSLAIGVPSGVAAALTEELGLLSEQARLVLQGAAVAGDPFEPELAGAAAGTSEALTMDALDKLLQLDLVRETDVPRRFRFRHPLVRRAVYETTAGGWRLGAHERCAEALARPAGRPTACTGGRLATTASTADKARRYARRSPTPRWSRSRARATPMRPCGRSSRYPTSCVPGTMPR